MLFKQFPQLFQSETMSLTATFHLPNSTDYTSQENLTDIKKHAWRSKLYRNPYNYSFDDISAAETDNRHDG